MKKSLPLGSARLRPTLKRACFDNNSFNEETSYPFKGAERFKSSSSNFGIRKAESLAESLDRPQYENLHFSTKGSKTKKNRSFQPCIEEGAPLSKQRSSQRRDISSIFGTPLYDVEGLKREREEWTLALKQRTRKLMILQDQALLAKLRRLPQVHHRQG